MLFLAATALANGLTSHVYVSERAITYLPDGELRDLVADPALWPYLRNGTQFPDGGYAMGEAYSETAHWEPFQNLYLGWIQDTYGPDFASDEARQHIAYWLGLSSHGMADQVFDSLYMQRAYVYDAESDWSNTSMDHSTDVALAAATGGYPLMDAILFPDPFVALMADAGVEVDEDTLETGQNLTMVAVAAVGGEGASAEHRAEHEAAYPWAYAHMMDETVDGCPEWEARVVAEYWQARWAQLHGETAANEPILYTFPQDGDYDHPTDATSVESRVTVVFSRGLVSDLVGPALFEVVDADGEPVTLAEPWVFYGTSSHVVHLAPAEDWAEDMTYTVTVRAGAPYIDGTTSAEDVSFVFHTGPAPEEEPMPSCTCQEGGAPVAAAALGGIALLAVRRRR